jgi:WD40 repeat protein
LARMGTVRLRHAGHAFSVAFLPDGKSFVSGGYDGKVFLWDVGTAQRLREFTPDNNAGGIDAVAVSRDGKMLASGGGDGIVRLWDLSTAKQVVGFKGHLKRIHGVAFSPDGKLLASGSEDQTIRLWDVSTGKQVGSWKAHPEWGVRTVIFSRDGQILASIGSSEETIQLWETATGRHLRQLGESGGGTCAVCFSPDGKTLIASPNGFKPICVWETATGRLLRQFGKADAAIWSLSVSVDGKILAGGGSDGNCRLWDLGTGELIRQFHGNGEDLHSVALSPNGHVLAAASRNHAIYLWDVATGRELHLFSSHRFFLTSAVFTPDGKGLYTGAFDRTVRFWNSTTGREIHPFWDAGDWIISLALAPDGATLAAGTGRRKKLIGGKEENLAVRLWDIVRGKELPGLEGHLGPFVMVAFSPDGNSLASRDGTGTLRVWNMRTRKEQWRIKDLPERDTCAIVFSPDGKEVACRKDDDSICLWNATTGKVVREFRAPQQGVRSLVFSPDGKTLFAGGYTQPIRLWEVASGKERLHFEGSPVHVTEIALSPDGRTLASASYPPHLIRFWDTATGQKLAEFDMVSAEALAFSPDGQRLASGGSDGTALVWDVANITTREQPLSKPLSPKQSEALWMDLAAQDAGRAYQAISTLVMSQDRSVSFLKKHLAPVPAVDNKELARLIADLDSNQFMVREKASTQLEKLGELAVPACRQALHSTTSVEVRRRLEAILERESRLRWNPPPERLRILRLLEVLEHIGTPEAQQVLESLAKGAPEARLTQEAKASLDRLQKLAANKP